MSRHRWLRFAGCLLVLSLFSPSAVVRAQPGAQPKPRTEQTGCKGVIKEVVGPKIIKVGNDTTSEWLVAMPEQAKDVHLTGKALPGWLIPGRIVRFTAPFDAKGRATEPIAKLDVIELRPQRQGEMPEMIGILPAGAVGDAGGAGGGGVGTGGVGGAAAGGRRPNVGRAKEQGGNYRVVGELQGVKNREIVVMVATVPTKVTAELKENAEISVDIADYTQLQVGDAVEVTGWCYPQNPAQIQATSLTIKAKQALGTEPAEKPAKSGSKSSTGRTKPKPKTTKTTKTKEPDKLPF